MGCGKQRDAAAPSKTAAWIPELAVEDLPSAELRPWFLSLQCRTSSWVEYSDDDDDDDNGKCYLK